MKALKSIMFTTALSAAMFIVAACNSDNNRNDHNEMAPKNSSPGMPENTTSSGTRHGNMGNRSDSTNNQTTSGSGQGTTSTTQGTTSGTTGSTGTTQSTSGTSGNNR